MTIRSAVSPSLPVSLSALGKIPSAASRFFRLLLLPAITVFASCDLFGQEVQVPTADGGGDVMGAQVGRWRLPVRISVSLSGGYDQNPNNESSNSQGSISTGASINLAYEFGTLRTRANLSTGTGIVYYPDLDHNQYDPNLYLNLSVNHQVNLKMTLAVSVNVRYAAEPDFSGDLTLDRRAGNYFTTADSIAMTYQWLPRFSTVTSYSFSTILYDDRAVANTYNRFDQGFSQSIRFLYLPVTTLVAQYSLSASLYDGGMNRNSYTQALLLGFDHTFSQKLQGFLRAGIEFRDSQDSAFETNDGFHPHFDGGLNYEVTDKTSLSWNASYATQESYVPLSSGSLTFRTGLVASHVFTPRISANLACYYSHNDNGGIEIFPGFDTSFNEDSFDLSLSLSYAINRFLTASAAYGHSEVMSELADRSYSRNRYSGGLSISF